MIATIIIIFIVFVLKLNSTKIKGAFGEFKIDICLKFLSSDYEVLNDVLIKCSNGNTTQIDHIILSEFGIFVVETKNYKGWIFGKETAENWTQIIYKERNSFRNPVKQNWAHVYALKNILADFPAVKYYPIVVFAGRATLKNVESSVPVIYSGMLRRTIKKYSVAKCITKDDLLGIKLLLENVQISDKVSRKQHIQNIRQRVTEKQIKVESLICPRCNGALKLRKGKYGQFYGCSNYPNCKFTMPY